MQIGAKLLGVLGALVAIPIAAAIQIALKDIWQNRPSSVVGAAGERSRPTRARSRRARSSSRPTHSDA